MTRPSPSSIRLAVRRQKEAEQGRLRPWRNPVRRAGIRRRLRAVRALTAFAVSLLGVIGVAAAVVRFDPLAGGDGAGGRLVAPANLAAPVLPDGRERLLSAPERAVAAVAAPGTGWTGSPETTGGPLRVAFRPPPAAPIWSDRDRERIVRPALPRLSPPAGSAIGPTAGPPGTPLARPGSLAPPSPPRPLVALPGTSGPGQPAETLVHPDPLALAPVLVALAPAGAGAANAMRPQGLRAVRPVRLPRIAPPAMPERERPGRRAGPGRIALIIDDVGVRRDVLDDLIALPAAVTLSILPYAQGPDEIARRARRQGHEVMLHLPMEPESRDSDPGPRALRAGMSPRILRRHIAWNLARFDGFVGVNNHMGSRFTSSEEEMRVLMTLLRERGLFFLDSLTTITSRGAAAAEALGVPFLSRDIFLDHRREPAAIAAQLLRLERTARREGIAIGIGHPYRETITALRAWLPGLEDRGVRLVPISSLLSADTRP